MKKILTLDEIVTEFVNNSTNEEHIEFLDKKIIPLCEKIAARPLQKIEKRKWSRKVNINESIDNIYQFLKQEINPNIANQFMNLIRQEKYGNVKVQILPRSEYRDKNYYINEVDEKGKVHIYFNETPNDMFSIIHEMVHKMNETYTIIDNQKYQTQLAGYFDESPSVMAEKLLGQWLIKNKKITHNDLRMFENDRLKNSKVCVREALIQNELIKMKQAGKELTPENVLQMLKEKANNSSKPIAEIFKKEIEEPLIINFILSNQEMTFLEGQQYVMAQHLTNNLKNRENPKLDFMWLHNNMGDQEAEVKDIIETIDDYNTNPKKMDEKDKIINTVVLEYIKNPNNSMYIRNLETIKEMCEEVLKQPYPEIEKEEWSRTININTAIECNYQFLKTISPMLAAQFMNLIQQNNENEKFVNIKPYIDKEKDLSHYSNSIRKLFMYYKNNLEDIFTLLHEMIHAMNYCSIDANGKAFLSYGQNYIMEVPSLISERLLGKWLVENKIITQNDYNLYTRNRLEDSKEAACIVLIEKEIIDMKYKNGLYIIRPRVIEKIKNKCNINNSINFSEKEEEICRYALGDILINKKLNFTNSQKYVIGQYIADKLEKDKNPEKAFLRFHNFAGKTNLSTDRILRIIRRDYQEEMDR